MDGAVRGAGGRCGGPQRLRPRMVADAVPRLALPMNVDGAQQALDRIMLVMYMLNDSFGQLALAASSMAAAGLFVFRAAAPNPMAPLLTLLDARGLADGACDSLQRCSGHLRAAISLLDHPGLPGVDGFLEAERAAAHGSLEAARDLAGMVSTHAINAISMLH
ncbi:hypothetical protein ACP70R_031121 [Stipagrostis hirtigluma subsp. patula]